MLQSHIAKKMGNSLGASVIVVPALYSVISHGCKYKWSNDNRI